MPEILEVEHYRRGAASIVHRTICDTVAADAWYLKRGLDQATLRRACEGRTVEAVGRRGKLLMLVLDSGVTVGLRFGMTGRLVVDGAMTIDKLRYGSDQRRPEWQRVRFSFDSGQTLAIDDPRRLGGVELDPDVDALGPDALSLSAGELAAALAGARGPLKARLMDQSRIAGLGNLLTDEALWRAGLDPGRDADDLGSRERARLWRAIDETLRVLCARGGSHTGDLQPARVAGARCPRSGCSGAIVHRTIGGRSTFSCARHQK